jgi:hypothetical protein
MANPDLASEVVKLSEKFNRQNKVEEAVKLIHEIMSDCKTRNVSLKLASLTLCFELRNLSQDRPIHYSLRSGLLG